MRLAGPPLLAWLAAKARGGVIGCAHSFGGSVESTDPQSPREQCGAVGKRKALRTSQRPTSSPVSIPISTANDLLRRDTYPWSDSPLCDPPTLLEPLCLSGASETLSRTERPAQQKRPPSGLRTEASVWHAPSAAAPGQARWRPQGETKHALGALFCVILRGDQNPGGYVEGWQAWTHMPGAAHR